MELKSFHPFLLRGALLWGSVCFIHPVVVALVVVGGAPSEVPLCGALESFCLCELHIKRSCAL